MKREKIYVKNRMPSVQARLEKNTSAEDEGPGGHKLVMRVTVILGFLLPFVMVWSGLLTNPETGNIRALWLLAVILTDTAGCLLLLARQRRKMKAEQERRRNTAKLVGEPTVVLYDADAEAACFSLVSDEYEPIQIKRFPFYIGKDKTYSDRVLAYPGVSRFHLKIDKNGNDVVISDLNSTNGTFLNGERLSPHLPVRVRRGDEIRIANCIYYCN